MSIDDHWVEAWQAKFGPGGTHSHRPTAVLGAIVPQLLKELGMLNASKFVFSEKERRYIVEVSDLGWSSVPHSFPLLNCPGEGQHRVFNLRERLTVGEEVMGWLFEEAPGPNHGLVFDGGRGVRAIPLTVLVLGSCNQEGA
jgi:hypothetical protein